MLNQSDCRFLSARRNALLASLALIGMALLGQSHAKAFTLEESGEWVIACDNAATCSAVNASQLMQMRMAQPSPFGTSRVCMHRRAGPDAKAQLFVTLRTLAPKELSQPRESRSLRVVGAKPTQGDIPMLHRGAEHWEVPSEATHALLASIEGGAQLLVIAPDGATVERLSLSGIDRAMSVFDHSQGRSGTITALREKGTRSAASVPHEKRPETLVTAPLSPLSAETAASPEAIRLRREACGSPRLDATKGYRLLGDQNRPDRILWVTPCDSQKGLRQTLFVIQNADGSAIPVAFPSTSPERPTGQPGLLSMPEFDAQTGRIRELWREPVPPPRGSYCAIQRLWGWNGSAFELADERRSLSCAGVVSGYWPRTYTRQIVTPAPQGAAATASAFRPPC